MLTHIRKNQVVWSMDGLQGFFESLTERILILEVLTEDKKSDLMLREAYLV